MEKFGFISYSHRDMKFVLQLESDFKRRNVPIWRDEVDIPPGESWPVAIEAAIKASSYVIVVLSPAAVHSVNVQDEIHYAVDLNKKIIPVRIKECETPFRIRRLHRIDFMADTYERDFRRLLQAIQQIFTAKPGQGGGGGAPTDPPGDDWRREPAKPPDRSLTDWVVNRQRNQEKRSNTALVFQRGKYSVDIPITQRHLIIGRDEDCDIVVNMETVSGRHAEIQYWEGRFWIRDLDSRNGTKMNDSPLTEPMALSRGDVLTVADVAVRFTAAVKPSQPTEVKPKTAPLPALGQQDPGQPEADSITVPALRGVGVEIVGERVLVNAVLLDPPLTTAQYAFLRLLVRADGKVCARNNIARVVWPDTGVEWVSNETIKATAAHINRSLAAIDPEWTYVIPEDGTCFRLNNRPLGPSARQSAAR